MVRYIKNLQLSFGINNNAMIVLIGLILIISGNKTIVFAKAQNANASSDGNRPAINLNDNNNQMNMKFYEVSAIKFSYLSLHPDLPKLSLLGNTKVTLGVNAIGYVAPGKGQLNQTKKIKNLLPKWPVKFSEASLQQIILAIKSKLQSYGLLGVYVGIDANQITKYGKDIREVNDTTINIVILVAQIDQIHTTALGENFDLLHKNKTDIPSQSWIIKKSPLKPSTNTKKGSLLYKDSINNYVNLLNRQPGREVNVSLSPSDKAGKLNLNYLINQNKPWSIYSQLSNTGTKQTKKLIEQFGIYSNQLTNNDDIFSLNYSTAGFDKSHAITGRYEAPLGKHNLKTRWAGQMRWSQYTASDIGFSNDKFSGTTWGAKLELIPNLYQKNNFFIDAIVGARYEKFEVDNTLPGTKKGNQDFLLPFLGIKASMDKNWYHLFAKATIEGSDGSWLGANKDNLKWLGRGDIDKNWIALDWNLSYSVFLEPLLNYDSWSDPTTPKSSTLAHEISLRLSGQYSFGYRLPAQEEQVAGGFYSVRGYPQSVVAGDDIYIMQLEYSFHLPRVFNINKNVTRLFGHPFRVSPQYVYGMPDWDLAPKVFFDSAYVSSNKNQFGYGGNSNTLLSAGVGVNASLKRNIHAELDWGFVLKKIPGEVSVGSNRLQFVVTVLY